MKVGLNGGFHAERHYRHYHQLAAKNKLYGSQSREARANVDVPQTARLHLVDDSEAKVGAEAFSISISVAHDSRHQDCHGGKKRAPSRKRNRRGVF
jgi:hypothetical protein